jgi:hypothetical protein
MKRGNAPDLLQPLYAILTDRACIPAEVKKDLKPLIGKFLQ